MFGAFVLLIANWLVRGRRRRSVTGAEGLVGEIGRTATAVHESGKVRVHGEIWNAQSEQPIPEGCSVSGESVRGLVVHVRAIEE